MNTPTLFGTEPANLAGATLDPERIYRYVLWRHWDLTKPPAILIGLNPSTADEHTNDPTIRKETRLAMSWGMGGLIKLNIFGFRATQPADMKRATDPIGPENDRYLIEYCSPPGLVIACWGSHGAFMERGQQVRAMLEPICQLHYLKLSENTGQPWHPLYLPEKGLVPVVWS